MSVKANSNIVVEYPATFEWNSSGPNIIDGVPESLRLFLRAPGNTFDRYLSSIEPPRRLRVTVIVEDLGAADSGLQPHSFHCQPWIKGCDLCGWDEGHPIHNEPQKASKRGK